MKKLFLPFLPAIFFSFLCSGTEENVLTLSSGITLRDGFAEVARKPVNVFRDDSPGTSGLWKTEKAGEKETLTTAVPLKGTMTGYSFSLTGVDGQSTEKTETGKAASLNRIEWFSRENKVLRTDPFPFPAPGTTAETVRLSDIVPEGAVSVRICMEKRSSAKIQSVHLTAVPVSGPFLEEGTLEGGPVLISGAKSIQWTGECPDGTEILFQFASAPDDRGIPGKWSPFTGPDGNTSEWYDAEDQSFFTREYESGLYPEIKGKCWIRWRAKLISNPRAGTVPVLKEFCMGELCSGPWKRISDCTEPMITFCCSTPSEDPRLPFSLIMTDDSEVDWNSVLIRTDGKKFDGEIQRTGNTLRCIPRELWTPGIHTVEASVSDLAGTRTSSRFHLNIGEAVERKIFIRRDGGVMLDGKAFFPVGIFDAAGADFSKDPAGSVKLWKEAGINLVHTGDSKILPDLVSAMQETGIRVFAPVFNGANGRDRDVLRNTVQQYRSRDAVIAWYIGDDTASFHTPGDFADRAGIVKTMDPARLTVHSDAAASGSTKSGWRSYTRSADVFMPELFSVRDEIADACVAQVVQDMQQVRTDLRETGGTCRSIWPVIQYFQDGKQWKRVPDGQELRAMSFAAAVSGANGILWYSYAPAGTGYAGISRSENDWKIFSAVSKEIASYADVLAEKPSLIIPEIEITEGAKENPLKGPAIACSIRQSGKRTVLFAVNTLRSPVSAELKIPGLDGAKELGVNAKKEPEKKGILKSFMGLFKSGEILPVRMGPLEVRIWELQLK